MREDVKGSYDESYGESKPNRKQLALDRWPRTGKEICAYFAKPGQRVLDIGCGSGLVLYNVRDKYEELVGIELSEVRTETTKKTLEGLNFKAMAGDIEAGVDFPDDHFDTIMLSDVIEHVVNVWPAMEEMTRILKPGGQVILTTPNIATLKARIKLLRGVFPSTSRGDEGFETRTPNEMLDGGHLHYFTFSMCDKMFERYGYSKLEHVGAGRYGKVHDLWPSLLSGTCNIIATL